MQISHHDYPVTVDDPTFGLLEVDRELWDGVLLDIFGTADLGQSAKRRWAEGLRPEYLRQELISASIDGEVVGVAMLELPQLDNRHIAYFSLIVAPQVRGRGVGAALFEEVLATGHADGRHNFQAWTWEHLEPRGTRRLTARDGDGAIDPDSPSASFLLHRGFRLAQVDTMSTLVLPAQAQLERDAAAAADATGEGYDVVQWSGATPETLLDDMAALAVTMSTDIPTGEAELEPEVYDAERVRANETMRERGGVQQLVTAARHRDSGRLVGFTRIVVDAERPTVADQWETVVERAHRGHQLGWLIKTHSHAALRKAFPDVLRIVTGNASENSHMLAINTRLGFVPSAASGWFERRDEVA